MFLDHHGIDSLGVLECEEAETTRATRGTIAHDLAIGDIAKLLKVFFERFYGGEESV